MSNREFTISGRLRAVENKDEHGTWVVYDIASGKRLAGAVRLVCDIAHLVQHLQPAGEPCRVCGSILQPVCLNPQCTEEFAATFPPERDGP